MRSTVTPSSISRTVSGNASIAACVSSLPDSISRVRSSPVPENARSSSSTVVRNASVSTVATNRSKFSSTSAVLIGVSVLSFGISEPSSRNGPPSEFGTRFTYCSPTAVRFAITARVSTGTSVPSSRLRFTATPS